MAYGEYICGEANNEKNMIFINLSWSSMGMIIEGKLSYGKSGYSGEIGHFPMLDNGKIYHAARSAAWRPVRPARRFTEYS